MYTICEKKIIIKNMTSSRSIDDKSLETEKTFSKDDANHKETSSDHVSPKENAKVQANLTTKPDTKKLICKYSQTVAKNNYEEDISKQRVTRTKAKILNKPQSPSNLTTKYNKRNRRNKNDTDKECTVSPNHRITKYFSNLDLRENSSSIDEVSDRTLETTLNEDNLKRQSSHPNLKSTTKPLHHIPKIDTGNHKLTEYFAIRRSDRKLKKDSDYEKQKDLEKKIVNETEDGLEVKEFNQKGRGIITTKEFNKGDFVIEYIGDLIDRTTAKQRECKYAKSKNIGCYMYYFRHKDRQYCIDATQESGKMGRLINHSRKGNLISRIIEVNKVPHLVLFAKADIPIGVELLYDYGDRNQESIKNHPWLNL